MAKLKEDKEFLAFLKKNKVEVKQGRILIKDAKRIPALQDQFLRMQSKKSGLPKSLVPDAEKVIEFSVSSAPRDGQKPEKFNVEILDSQKNYETGDWSGVLKGKVKDLFKALNAEQYGIGSEDIEEELLEAIKYQD